MSDAATPSRRAVLMGAVAALAVGCRPRRSPQAPGPPPADSAALQSARQAEVEVLSTYSAAMRLAGPTAQAALRPLLDDHRRHLSALDHEIPAGHETVMVIDPRNSRDLAAAERRTATALARAAAGAGAGGTSALLASIAASHRGHVALLTRKPFHW